MSTKSRHNHLLTLCGTPTAPFHEQNVIQYLEERLDALSHVSHRRDRHGNIIAHYQHQLELERPLALTGHMDHPGFHVLRGGASMIEVEFLGYVKDEYYPGSVARFYPGKVRGTVKEMLTEPGKRPKRFTVEVEAEVATGAFGVWDLPAPGIDQDRAQLPAADDLAGVAAILSALEEVALEEATADFYILFTRAEEVGFAGALGFCMEKALPENVVMLAVETSKETAVARIGEGPIIRTGDRISVFDNTATRLLVKVAEEIAGQGDFKYQRALMDGGTCESTAYQQFGWTSAALCVALGNYHNMGPDNRIAPEVISTADYNGLVDFFKGAVTSKLTIDSARTAHQQFLQKIYGKWGKRLQETA
jgi:putative aminopeptidase FrvX